MSRRSSPTLRTWVGACAACLWAAAVGAHSASDAYLTLTVDTVAAAGHAALARSVLHGQWDVALRDLDFVMGLDDDGDGRLTWKEMRLHSVAIERYVYPHLRFVAGGGAVCTVHPGKMLVDEHADGAYAALFFDLTCTGKPPQVKLGYDLFFAIDPSHRGIFVMRKGDDLSTSVLSPDNAKIDIAL